MPDVQDIVAEVLRDDEYVLGTFGDTGPQGEKGDQGEEGPQGPAGPSNVLSIGTVVRGDDAAASITGTSPNQILNLTLPKGDQGIQGPEGPTGFAPIANVTKSGDTVTISITDENGTTTESLITSYQEPLLSAKWSDHLLSDISWLRADTFSWQSGETYSSAYQHLLDDIGYVRYMIPNDDIQEKFYRSPSDDTTMFAWTNQYSTLYTENEFPENGDNFYYHNQVFGTVLSTGTEAGSGVVTPTTETIAGTTITYYLADDGHKIVLADQETNVSTIYTATGVAWYYVLDTTNTQFKLPRTQYSFVGLRDRVGKYVEPGLPNITGGLEGIGTSSSNSFGPATGCITKSTEYNGFQTGNSAYMKRTNMGIDASLSSNIYGNSDTVQSAATQMYLYFYVGQFTQTATEQTAGLNSELFNGKVDLNLNNMNPSQAAKNTIVSWSIPDYTAGVSLINTASYENTITTKGFVLFNAEYTSGNDRAFVKKGSNGIPYQTAACHNYGNTYYDGSHDIVPVDVGDIVYNEAGLITMTFFPCKGV